MSDASSEIRRSVERLVIRAGGQTVKRQVLRDDPGCDFEVEDPEPVAAIRAAASLRFAAGQELSRAARYAREDGRTWQEIGEALFPAEPVPDDDPKSVRAFRELGWAYSDYDSPAFGWTCPDCRKRISDHGPGAGHPADAERGHAAGCGRLARAVDAYDQQWEEDEEPWEDDE